MQVPQPYDIFYFIILFTICIFGGTYLLFSYNKNKLTILNAILFYLCSIRIFTEFYIQQVDSLAVVENIGAFHSSLLTFMSALLWLSVWFYIRPFRRWEKEKYFNQLFTWILIILPFILSLPPLIKREIFQFHPEKINGLWFYQINSDSFLGNLGDYYIQGMSLLMVALFIFSIIQSPKNRIKKILLALSFIIIPLIYFSFIKSVDGLTIPNMGLLYLSHTIIVSWFVSEYRLFRNQYYQVKNDLLNSISELAITTDLNLNILSTNDKFQKVFGINQKYFRNLLALNSKFTLNEVDQILYQLVNNITSEVELVLNNIEEKERILRMKVAPLRKGANQFGYMFLLTDLTEAKANEKRLQALNTAKDHLFAIISHDLRKPALSFRGISGKVNYLIQRNEIETLQKLGDSLEKSANSLNTLLNNLLNWALKEKAMLPYNPIPLNVLQVTEDIYNTFMPLADNKQITLSMDIEPTTIAFIDPNALNSILRNLLDNAIKYTPNGGKVAISAKTQQELVVLKVADTGLGIPKHRINNLFEILQNKSTRGTTGESGSGIGLNLVKDLVELNKGQIKVQSKINTGTTFEILLPAA